MLNEDYREILQILLKNDVKFLIVGAYAMAAYGYPRSTGDFDIWVDTTSENSQNLYKSLAEFGAHLSELTPLTFTEKGVIFQIGVAPRRIDIITKIDGVEFSEAYLKREIIEVENLKLPFLSKADLIRNKKATGREKDKVDLRFLEGDNQG